jgi:hypothetical protein
VVPPWNVSGRDENGKEGWNGHLYCLKIVYTEREREREREREGVDDDGIHLFNYSFFTFPS